MKKFDPIAKKIEIVGGFLAMQSIITDIGEITAGRDDPHLSENFAEFISLLHECEEKKMYNSIALAIDRLYRDYCKH